MDGEILERLVRLERRVAALEAKLSPEAVRPEDRQAIMALVRDATAEVWTSEYQDFIEKVYAIRPKPEDLA